MKRFDYVNENGRRVHFECDEDTTPPQNLHAFVGLELHIFYLETRAH
jgi:hypothetical protein